ncbi:uncharacterized protein LOC124145039 [Haliotis rufescens]|uniref:uncharacterized protein LOC124145039 n=1 Tax=Haliotis rufescens TaxID=6454 RepID=UPI00201EE4AE|nr:uncharacterized protein LOC124145039 [Haliotis rufescens]
MWILGAYLCIASCMALDQEGLNDLGKNLQIKWLIKDNTQTETRAFAEIILTNNGNTTLSKDGDWRIHLDTIFLLEPDYLPRPGGYELPGQGIRINHLVGTQFTIAPTDSFFDLLPGRSRKIKLQLIYWVTAKTDMMPNWFIVAAGLVPHVLVSTVGETLDFVQPITQPQQFKRYNYDRFAPFSLEERFSRFAVDDLHDSGEIRVIPKPMEMTLNRRRSFQMDVSNVAVHSQSGLDTEEQIFKQALKSIRPTPGTTTTASVKLQIGSVTVKNTSLYHMDDAYSIDINPTSSTVTIIGSQPSGVLYGIQTLLQLIREANGKLFTTLVRDAPRYGYRGLFLDAGRNFYPKDDVIGLIDKMASYKLNKFHFHLSDDEGWRLEIPGLQELTQFGSQRCFDPSGNKCLPPQIGSGPTNCTSGSGFYSVADYREILRFAKDRHIEIIPEFDLPGHARAAVQSMELRYNNLKMAGNDTEALKYRLVEGGIKDWSKYLSIQMYVDDAVNPCIESTYSFINHVMEELSIMHRDIQPLRIFNFGGDEVAEGAWDNSTACRQVSNSSVVNVPKVKEHFFRKVVGLGSSRNLDIAAWEDGLLQEGSGFVMTGAPDQSTGYKMFSLNGSHDVYAYVYQNIWEWGNAGRAYNLANNGYKVVMCPATLLNFDFPYEPDPLERGYYWAARYIDSRKAFSFMPENLYGNIDTQRSGEPISHEEACGSNNEKCPPLLKPGNIVGIQGHLWSDTLRSTEDMHMRAFPRMLSLAERAWHKADWESMDNSTTRDQARHDDWSSYVKAVGLRELPWLDSEGIDYRVAPPAARVVDGLLVPITEFPGLRVQYQDSHGNWIDIFTNSSTDRPIRTRTADGKRYSRAVKYDSSPPYIAQPTLDRIADSLVVNFSVIDNLYDGCTSYKAQLTLTNNGTLPIEPGNWGIYFNSETVLHNIDSGMTAEEFNEGFFAIKPQKDFKPIMPNEKRVLNGEFKPWSVSKYDQMPNWFVAAEGLEPRILPNTVGESLDFVSAFDTPNKWKRCFSLQNAFTDVYKPFSPEDRFNRNPDPASKADSHKTLIPTPMSLTSVKEGDMATIYLDKCCWTITSDVFFTREASFLKDQLSAMGLSTMTLSANTAAQSYIRIKEDVSLSEDGYTLTMEPKYQGILISASTKAGAFYGIQSLISLALRGVKVGVMSAVSVKDKPRYHYRGLLLDVASNFYPKETLFRVLDLMAMYKMNKLHLHLTNNYAWRIEVSGLDGLSQIGSQRCFNQVWLRCLYPQFGSGPTNSTSGFYRKQDYEDILKYAAYRHIEVIPEISLPGNAHAAIQAMAIRKQTRLDVGDFNSSEEFMLTSIPFKEDVPIGTNTINPMLSSTFDFFSLVFDELYNMHQNINPLKTMHFGGGEATIHAWSDAVVDHIMNSLSATSFQIKLVKELSKIVSSKNVTLAGFEEGFMSNIYDIIPKQQLSGRVMAYEWKDFWADQSVPASQAYLLANDDYELVVASSKHLNLDTPYEPDPQERGEYWASRYTDTKKVFEFMPGDIYSNIHTNSQGITVTRERVCGNSNAICPRLTRPQNVIGMQAQLWTDEIRTEQQLFEMLLPRMLAVAERAWHKAPWENLKYSDSRRDDDWLQFSSSIGLQEMKILDRLNYTYHLPPPGAKLSGPQLHINTAFPGLPVEASVDAGQSWITVNPVSGMTVIDGQTVLLRTRSPSNQRKSRVITMKISGVTIVPVVG